MAEGYQVGSCGYLLTLQGILQPLDLCLTIGSGTEQIGKKGIAVHLVLGSIQTDDGYLTHSHSEVSSQIPIAATAFFRLAEHPHTLQSTVGQAARIMVARREEIGDTCCKIML